MTKGEPRRFFMRDPRLRKTKQVTEEMLKKIAHISTIILDAVVASFFAAILLITVLEVILRYGFNASMLYGSEAMEGLFIYTTAIGAAVAIRRRLHINIDFMVKLLPILLQKILDILMHLLVAFLNGVMIYYSVTWISKVGGHASPVMRIPEWTFQISIPIGCSLVIFYCLVNILLTLCGEWVSTEDQAC
jgi:TRAP-type C4-dicarboxylate transport system permease small subunit